MVALATIAAVAALPAGGVGAANYRVELSEKSVKELDKLERKDKHSYEIVVKHLQNLEQDPQHFGKPLTGSLSGLWSCRAGDLRIIYQIQEGTKAVLVFAIGRRENVYDKGGRI